MIRSLPLAVLTRGHALTTFISLRFNLFNAYCVSLNVIQIDFKSEPGTARNFYGAISFNLDFRDNHIPRKVTRTGRDITGKRESGKAGERNIVRTTDARFQHPAAPHRHTFRIANIMNVYSMRVAT